MTQVDYEKGQVVAATWRLSFTSDTNELLAVACVIRNSVVRRGFKGYGQAINHYLTNYPLRPFPLGTEPQLVDPDYGLLSQIDGVYDNLTPDITSSKDFPFGATHFCSARNHPERAVGRNLIGTFGGQQFYE